MCVFPLQRTVQHTAMHSELHMCTCLWSRPLGPGAALTHRFACSLFNSQIGVPFIAVKAITDIVDGPKVTRRRRRHAASKEMKCR